MKKNMIICGILATLVIIGIRCSDNKNTSKNGEKVKDTLSLINRGKFLVTVGGCNDCHSPKIMTEHGPTLDPSRMLSGQNENEPIPAFDEKAVSKGIMQANAHLTAWKGP